jgi:(2Fe-2S) ferredoxin
LDGRYKITVCRGPECGDRRFSRDVHAELARLTQARGLGARIVLDWQTCFGRCRVGPNVLVRRILPGEDPWLEALVPRVGCEAVLYSGVAPRDAVRIVGEHVEGGRVIQDLVRKAD